MNDTMTVDLTLTDCEVLVIALAQLVDEDGNSAWSHPRVMALRHKLAEAIKERSTLGRGNEWVCA